MTDQQSRRVKVIEASYNEEVDLVKWFIEDVETSKRKTIAYKGTDLGPAMGIVGELSPDHIRLFCDSMKGKEFNHIDIAENLPPRSNEGGMSDTDMFQMHDHIDRFPYKEVMQDAHKEIEDKKE